MLEVDRRQNKRAKENGEDGVRVQRFVGVI